MKAIGTLEELASHDSSEAFPSLDWGERLLVVQRAVARLKRDFGLDLALQDPSGFQDGALFTRADELSATGHIVLGGYFFSKFGSLFCGGRRSGESAASAAVWDGARLAIARDYGFTYVPDELFAAPYDGVFVKYRCTTWGERFFCAFYSRPTMPSTRRAKTHAREG